MAHLSVNGALGKCQPRPKLDAPEVHLESGAVTPAIGRCYSLDDTPAALRHLGEGRAKGQLVITPHSGDQD